jgi:hypothetical protein
VKVFGLIKKNKVLILFLVVMLAMLEVNVGILLNDETVTATAIRGNANNRSAKNIDIQSVEKKFNEIKAIPYNEKNMNCKHKSELFADYLLEMGELDVHYVTIQHKSGKYTHEFVEWNGRFYDACNTHEISYQQSKEDYLKELGKIGFTGLIVQSPHNPPYN